MRRCSSAGASSSMTCPGVVRRDEWLRQVAPSDLPRALQETNTPPAYSAVVVQHTVAVVVCTASSAGSQSHYASSTLLAPLHASCRLPSLSLSIFHHCHCHVAHPEFDSHSEPPSLPSCHARRPSNLPCARAPARQPGFFFPSHQHGQTYDSSRWMYRARRPPETAETRSRSCSVLRPSPALASQIVNTRPLRSPALLSWHRFPRPGRLRCVLREGVIPTMPRTHGFG